MKRNRPAGGLWNIIYPILIYYAGYYVVCAVGVVLFQTFAVQTLTPVWNGILKGACMLGGLAFLYPIFLQEKEKRDFQKIKTISFFILAAFSCCAVVFMNILVEKSGLIQNSEAFQQSSERQFAVPLWLGLVLYGIIAPLAEEVLFRFILVNRIKDWTGSLVAGVLISSALFGIYHGNVVQGVYAFVLGSVLAMIYLYYGNILAAIVFHGIGNIIIFLSGIYPELHRLLFEQIPWYVYLLVFIVFATAYCYRFWKRKRENL